MKLSNETIEFIIAAGSRALATAGENDLNVVPVSMVFADGDGLVILDCFMGKTKENLARDPRAALACWQGFKGLQVKGTVSYEPSGNRFDRYVDKLKGDHPDRQLCGVLVMTPERAYDLTPGSAGAEIV